MLSPAQLRDRLPDRRLPVLYFAFAHLCLLAAFGVAAVDPLALTGAFYHPRMLAVVHLVTLGWITSSILGALYMILPMALKASLPAGRTDLWAFALFVAGVLGMVSHFWIGEASGMAWSGGMVLLPVLWLAGRVIKALLPARIPEEVKLHFFFAFANFALAAGLGLAIGISKATGLAPGAPLPRVYGHLHLAALGWATMMVMAAGYRLLPMLLPAAMPEGRRVEAGGVLLQTGVMGLTAALLAQARGWDLFFGLLCLAGIGLFLGRVRWMRAHPRPAPRELVRPDLGMWHVASALVYLVLAALLGLCLLAAPDSAWSLRAALAYGAFGLVGFLAQMVVGVAGRLIPMYAYMRAVAGSSFRQSPPSPHALPRYGLFKIAFALWTVGLPLAVAGLAFDHPEGLRTGALALFLAVLLDLAHQLRILRAAARPVVELPFAGEAGDGC